MSECGYIQRNGLLCRRQKERAWIPREGNTERDWCSMHLAVESNIRHKREAEIAKTKFRNRMQNYHNMRIWSGAARDIVDALLAEILAREPEINTIEKMEELLK